MADVPRIVIPLARSALITVAVFAFLNGWGDFIFALTILNGTSIVPITLGIYTYLGNYTSDWGAVMAAGSVRHGAGRGNAGGGTALHRKWPHGGFGGGVAMRPISPLKEMRVRGTHAHWSAKPRGGDR